MVELLVHVVRGSASVLLSLCAEPCAFGGMWSCEECTYDNEDGRKDCILCGATRSQAGGAPLERSAPTHTDHPPVTVTVTASSHAAAGVPSQQQQRAQAAHATTATNTPVGGDSGHLVKYLRPLTRQVCGAFCLR